MVVLPRGESKKSLFLINLRRSATEAQIGLEFQPELECALESEVEFRLEFEFEFPSCRV